MTNPASVRFVWHHWPDGSVVFDRVEGTSHVLSPMMRRIHSALAADPGLSTPALAVLASDATDAVLSDQAVDEARSLLASIQLA